MRTCRWYSLGAFAVASLLNPGYFAGCVSSSAEGGRFKYGAAEMSELARGANDSYELELRGETYRVDLDIEPSAVHAARGAGLFGRTVHACGDRRLIATASACVDSSSMAVAGTLSLSRLRAEGEEIVAREVPVEGLLMVHSLVLSQGEMDLKFDGGRLSLIGQYRGAYELSSHQLESLLPSQP